MKRIFITVLDFIGIVEWLEDESFAFEEHLYHVSARD